MGMTYKQCGSRCPPTCKTDDVVCTKDCVEGCFCPDGTVLSENGDCIDPSECPGKYTDIFIFS